MQVILHQVVGAAVRTQGIKYFSKSLIQMNDLIQSYLAKTGSLLKREGEGKNQLSTSTFQASILELPNDINIWKTYFREVKIKQYFKLQNHLLLL